jgi:hypothetical protein
VIDHLVLDETDHLVVECLGGGVGLVVLQERLEVQLVGHLLRLVPSQPGPKESNSVRQCQFSIKDQLYKQMICTFILL